MKKLVLALALLVSACGEKAAPGPTPATMFAPDPGEAEITLEAVTVTDQRLVLAVKATGTKPLYGVAFRLSYDAKVLKLAQMERGPGWPEGAVELAKEGAPGITVATVSGKGTYAGNADPLIATLTFDRITRDGTKVAFVTERSSAIDSGGKNISVKWRGGALK
jgi:hypothetical protein